MNAKQIMNTRHDYTFENVQRSCGHVDAVVEVTKSINSHAPSVLSGQEKMKCFACQALAAEQRKSRSQAAIQFGKEYCELHGIDPNDAQFSSENNGTAVEIRIWLEVANG